MKNQPQLEQFGDERYKVTCRTVRENKLVPFYQRPGSLKNIVLSEKKDGRLLHESIHISDDLLVRRYVAIWRSAEDLTNFNKLPEIQSYVRKKRYYEQENNQSTNIIGEDIDE